MTPIRASFSLFLFVGALAALAGAARAGEVDSDIDPRFRAKIVKQKIKMRASEGSFDSLRNGQGGSQDDADCGSQNIGNVNVNGKIGRAPREVFVYAPNAINFVSGHGCQ